MSKDRSWLFVAVITMFRHTQIFKLRLIWLDCMIWPRRPRDLIFNFPCEILRGCKIIFSICQFAWQTFEPFPGDHWYRPHRWSVTSCRLHGAGEIGGFSWNWPAISGFMKSAGSYLTAVPICAQHQRPRRPWASRFRSVSLISTIRTDANTRTGTISAATHTQDKIPPSHTKTSPFTEAFIQQGENTGTPRNGS